MIEKNFKYNMIYQLLSPVTFRDSPAHPVSFISKHGYDWLNADKQLEFWKYFSAQLESIVSGLVIYFLFLKAIMYLSNSRQFCLMLFSIACNFNFRWMSRLITFESALLSCKESKASENWKSTHFQEDSNPHFPESRPMRYPGLQKLMMEII